MKEYLKQLTAKADNDVLRACLAREYLQARVLESLQKTGTFLRWAFVGGTALRFLFSIQRFSEDLDFSLLRTGEDPGFRTALAEVERSFRLEGYRIESNINDRKTVVSAWLKFPGLPHETGFSPHRSQALSIKVEVDTRPPPGAVITTSIVRRHASLNLCHYDLPSLLAGKLHAAITRKYAKGRDWYDLMWYLSPRPPVEPNLTLLQSALDQTQGAGHHDARSWRKSVRERLATFDMKAVRDDVSPFLERPQEASLLTRENLESLLQG